MIDDDLITTRLVELHDHIRVQATPARLDVLRGERLVRRRRAVSGLAAAAAVVLTIGIAQASMYGAQLAPVPAQQPLRPATEPSGEQWTLERIREEGSPMGQTVTQSGITIRPYVVCDGPRSVCESDPPFRVPYQYAALEVTQGGRSSLFSLPANLYFSAQDFDAASVFVRDDPLRTTTHGQGQVRYRLLRADGTEVRSRLDDAAPAVPGPNLFVVAFDDDLRIIGADGYGADAVYLVDERTGTLQPLDAPRQGPNSLTGGIPRHWGPNVQEFLWFVDPDCRVGWAIDGTFQERQLNCAEGRGFKATYIHDHGFPDGWLQPGRMTLLEPNGDRLFLHVSLDYGSTWQRIPVSNENAVADVLRGLG